MKRVLFGLFLLLVASPARAAAPFTVQQLQTNSVTPSGVGPLNFNGGIFYPKLDTTGTVSDDAALQAAINSCSAVGGTVYLPPGRILLTGAAGTINLQNCRVVGAGSLSSADGSTITNGTEIDLTSTSVVPFTIGVGWEIENVNFYWPNQTGAVVYPALFSSVTNGSAADFVLLNNNVINAYDVINGVANSSWGRFYIEGGNYYATDAILKFAASIGDSSHLTSMHMSPGPWLSRCGGFTTTCEGYVDAGSQNNALIRAESGSYVQVYWDNSANFDWRYGFKVEDGGEIGSSYLSIAWDGTGTIVDDSAATTSGGFVIQNTMHSLGAVCGYHISYVSNTNDAYYPCFNTGPRAGLVLTGTMGWGSFSDGVEMAGGELILKNTSLSAGRSGLSANTYVVHATGWPVIEIDGSTLGGTPSSAYTQGIVATGLTANPPRLTVTNSVFQYLNQDIDAQTFQTTMIANDWSIGTNGASSITWADSAFPVYWSNNQFDKPPAPTVASCGTGATVSGVTAGAIQVGSTSPTTSCQLTLPFNVPSAGACVFTGSGVTVTGGPSGTPATWALSFSGDAHGQQVFYSCRGGN